MVGILIITHGTLGESLVHCASHIMGSRPHRLEQIGVTPQEDPQRVLTQALRLVRSLDDGDGVIIFTDIFGGTPSNVASHLLLPGRVEGVAGVSVPMLIRALTYRSEPLPVVLEKALSGGTAGVVHMPPPDHGHAATGS